MILVIATQDQENYAAHQGFTGEYAFDFIADKATEELSPFATVNS